MKLRVIHILGLVVLAAALCAAIFFFYIAHQGWVGWKQRLEETCFRIPADLTREGAYQGKFHGDCHGFRIFFIPQTDISPEAALSALKDLEANVVVTYLGSDKYSGNNEPFEDAFTGKDLHLQPLADGSQMPARSFGFRNEEHQLSLHIIKPVTAPFASSMILIGKPAPCTLERSAVAIVAVLGGALAVVSLVIAIAIIRSIRRQKMTTASEGSSSSP